MLNLHALHLNPHLHPDWTLILSAALPASLLALALAVFVLGYSLRRGHRTHRAELARIFEQLDLLRFDAQQDAAAATVATAPREANADAAADSALLAAVMAREPQLLGGTGDYYAAAQLAARGSSAAEIANRCGIVNGEARVLVALQQARSRRTEH
ncbi:MAG: DUF2802 domain-containing protein [Proteobacteria bacterium]|nr:DUF2802 domain-containing protein [Pseudomonadota bacterium]